MTLFRLAQSGHGGSDGGDPVRGDDPMAKEFPDLWDFLSQSRWSENEPRIRGTLVVCYGEGRWRICLSDKDSGQQSWVSSDTLKKALQAASAGLGTGKLEWRVDSRATSPKRKKD
jgi:hypothetical protein